MTRFGLAAILTAALAGVSIAQAGSTSRAVSRASVPTIATVAGTGTDGSDGDGGAATAAAINHPRGIAVLMDGSYVFAQPFADSIRRVDAGGTIATAVGSGSAGYSGDGGPAKDARLTLVHGVAAMPDGGYVLADMGNNRIRRVWADGRITTVAGSGVAGFSGDGGPATSALIALPRGIAARASGELLVPDTGNARIRRVSTGGVISTVAGSGVSGFSGDGGPATVAQLNRPFSVAPLPTGGFLVADLDNNRIRRVSEQGIIATVAGTGAPTFSGDGGPATSAALNQPHAVATLPDGGFLIADTYNHRVRRVWPDGRITTVAGTGAAAFTGDGPAASAALNLPKALAVLPDASGFLVGDAGNNRIRLVEIDLRPALRLSIMTPRLSTKAGRSATLRFTVSESTTMRLEVVRSGTVVSTVVRRATSGVNSIVFGRRLSPGTYALRLTASTKDDRKVTRKASLAVRR